MNDLFVGFFNLRVQGLQDLNLLLFVGFCAGVDLDVLTAGLIDLNLFDRGGKRAFLLLETQVFFDEFVEVFAEAGSKLC